MSTDVQEQFDAVRRIWRRIEDDIAVVDRRTTKTDDTAELAKKISGVDSDLSDFKQSVRSELHEIKTAVGRIATSVETLAGKNRTLSDEIETLGPAVRANRGGGNGGGWPLPMKWTLAIAVLCTAGALKMLETVPSAGGGFLAAVTRMGVP